MARAFISHTAEDETVALELAHKLEAHDISCWYFERDNVPGEPHLTTTQREISSSEAFIILISKASLDSEFVASELLHAAGCRKLMIPLFLNVTSDELSNLRPKWMTAIGFSTGLKWTTSDDAVEGVKKGIRHFHSVLSSADRFPTVDASARQPENAMRIHRLPFLTGVTLWKWSRLLHPRQEMRFVGSVFVRILDKGKYYLIRNQHRPETVGPFGGVAKFTPEARIHWNEWGFRSHVFGDAQDIERDVRGFVPAKYSLPIVRWYLAGLERESSESCLRRELKEDFAEAGIQCDPSVFSHAKFQFVRLIFDGPENVPGKDYWQFRIFEVYELDYQTTASQELINHLRDSSAASRTVVGATFEEIHAGRLEDATVVGSVTAFLFGQERGKYDVPIYESKPR